MSVAERIASAKAWIAAAAALSTERKLLVIINVGCVFSACLSVCLPVSLSIYLVAVCRQVVLCVCACLCVL